MMKHNRKLACALTLALLGATALAASSQTASPAAPSSSTPANPQPSNPQTPPPAATPPNPPAPQTAPAPPGQDTGNPNSPQYTIPINVNEVYLIFTVTDSKGHFIKDLQLNDFALLDDQKAPAQVFSFQQQTNLPLRVGLLIDASTSIRQRFQFEQQAATEFILQTIKPRSDKAFIMGFDVTPDLKQDWTNNLDLLETGINALRPGGGTALYDAVYTACRDKLADSARGQEPTRKALVLVSDGNDNQSRVYLDEAIKMCQRAETIVYAISTNTSPSRERGDDVLQKITDSTGGITFFPKRLEDISNGFHDIGDELRSQYALAYRPADFKPDGSFRPIYLYCNQRRYTVRVSKGYFAPKR
ncbi:von Willebrand factor, type A [Acidisarcina polymorpha]|uniref:von Willebrand factor, type A n=2 Tax=Acidisarcina polymorpha TaxID=2211140 RepID=A0A2Z5FYY2_9BACT|nr:von Willebrand factor, type A [Acidisarcina polymorpha]